MSKKKRFNYNLNTGNISNLLTEELFQELLSGIEFENTQIYLLKDNVNREVIMRILEKIAESRNPAFLPILKTWKGIAVRKVREAISKTEKKLTAGEI